MSRRRNLVGAGILAAALAGSVAVRQILVGRSSRPATTGPVRELWPAGTEHHRLEMGDGATIHLAERGTGRPVLLLHGITLSAAIWVEQLRRLPDRGFRVVAMDLRGHGRSTIGSDGLALDRLTADIAEVAERLDLDGAILVGHSMGGMAALRLLSTRTDLARGDGWLAGLLLVATSAQPAFRRGVPAGPVLLAAAGPLLAAAGRVARLLPGPSLIDSEVADPIAALTFGEDASPAHVRLTRRVTALVPARTSVDLLAQLVRLDETAGLRAIRVPTAVVVGADDLITPPGHARALADAITGAELTEIDGCGHMVMLERPDRLDDAVVALARRAP